LIKIKAYGICLYQKEVDTINVLLCKSVSSMDRWGFLKGVQEKNEKNEQTAIREFHEECGIKVDKKDLIQYFEQTNDEKDIGIYLVDAKIIKNMNTYFNGDKLLDNFLSWENIQVKFFNIDKLPKIKKKQKKIILNIVEYLKRK
jgi:8-oxo-dGTP pyrophosphatase MutT (NUDIX family)